MELVHFQPIPGSDGHVTGYLHTPITEMAVRRESFPTVVLCPGGPTLAARSVRPTLWPCGSSPGDTRCSR